MYKRQGVGNVAQAAAWQSMAAWMMYLNYQGKWDASPDMVGAVKKLSHSQPARSLEGQSM